MISPVIKDVLNGDKMPLVGRYKARKAAAEETQEVTRDLRR